MFKYAVTLFAGALIATGLTKIVRDFAISKGFAVGPSSARHIHQSPIPRLGGVAIFFTFLVGCTGYILARQFGLVHELKNIPLLQMVFPAALLFGVGLLDDLKGVSARTKLLAQIAGGIWLYSIGLRFVCLHFGGASSFVTNILCLSLTILWVIVVCNAVNLIDGLDGLAAGATLFSMATIFTFAMVDGRHGVALIIALLAGANLGFLIFNFNPASIFLGDSGSLFIGFMLGGLLMAESQRQPNVARVVLVPVISLALPLTDLGITVLRRFLSGHSLFGADREHIHHKLLDAGLTQRQVVYVLYTISATCAVASLIFLHPNRLAWIPVLALVLLFTFFLVRKLDYQEFSEVARLGLRIAEQKRIAASNIAVRRASAQLQRTYNTATIIDVLEDGLQRDFNGFEIVLAEGFTISAEMDSAPTNRIERAWVLSSSQHMVLTIALESSIYGHIGYLSLEHTVGRRLMVDTELLQNDLANALCLALKHCLLSTSSSSFNRERKRLTQRA